MKLVKTLMLSTALLIAPTAAFAGLIGGVIDTLFDDTSPPPSVPEPAGALVMGVALITVALVNRRKRNS